TAKAIFVQKAGFYGTLYDDAQYTFQDTDLYMKGYVISSDESGNFYQELVVQDRPRHPTAGIKIMIQADPLYTTFEFGRKIFVALDGFTIGFANGVIALGSPKTGADYLDKAPGSFQDKIIR